jgi:hypothetical protein
MIFSYFFHLFQALPLSIIYAFPIACLGALLALSFHIAFGAVVGLPSFYIYLKLHVRAVFISAGSIFRNGLYEKNVPFKIIAHDHGTSLPFRVVIIPGSWSTERYNWNRWGKYIESLQKCGSSVYKFQWHASNDEKSRSEAACYLRKWLNHDCEGVQKVVLIGHSYGGHVAALVRDHPLVSDVVTLASPFISTEKLNDEQIASNALALFTRAFLIPTLIWLGYTGYIIYSTRGIIGIIQPNPNWDSFVTFIGIASFSMYCLFVFLRLFWAGKQPAMEVSIPTQTVHCASMICVQVNGDLIVEQIESSANSIFSRAKESRAFLTQSAILPHGFKKWAAPYYFLCVIFTAHIYAFPEVATIFEVLKNYNQNRTLLALQGYFVFILYVLLVRALAKACPLAQEIKILLDNLSNLVDWDAMVRDNRRSVICILAGLPLHTRFVHSFHIRADISGAKIWKVDLPKSCTGLHKHSDVIENDDMRCKIIRDLCSRLGQATSA